MDIAFNSDFQINIGFVDDDKLPIGIPDYDFVISYFVFRDSEHKVIQHDGVITNGSIVDGQLVTYVNAGTLGRGRLFRRTTLMIPDLHYPDGIRDITYEEYTGINIV